MRRFRPEVVAAALLLVLTIPVYVAVGERLGAIVTATDDWDGPVPGWQERAIWVGLIGLAATNAIGFVVGALVAWLGRPGWRGALRTWAIAVSGAVVLAMGLELAGVTDGGPSDFGSDLLGWIAALPQTLLLLALIWLPGIALGTASAWLFAERPERLESE